MVACAPLAAAAESFAYAGRTIQFQLPKGFCLPGDSEVERRLHDIAANALPPTNHLAAFAMPCDELARLLGGNEGNFTRWVQIQVIRPRNGATLDGLSREAFLAQLNTAKDKMKVDAAEMSKLAQKALDDPSMRLGNNSLSVLGSDGNALYAVISGEYSGKHAIRFRGVAGITLVRGLAVSVNVYNEQGRPQEELFAMHRPLMNSLIKQN